MIKSQPQEHQQKGIEFLKSKSYGILGFKTGKGKTLTSLCCIDHHVYKKRDYAVVFGPVKAIDKTWGREIEKHSDMKYILLQDVLERAVSGGNKLHWLFDEGYDIILVKYSQVTQKKFQTILPALMKGRILVLDEAHKLKNAEAQVSIAMSYFSREARAKWGLTATSITNDILDLWGLMQYFSPRIFGLKWQFRKRYCELEEKVIGRLPNGRPKKVKAVTGYTNLTELRSRVEQFMMIVESDITVKYHDIEYSLTEEEDETYLVAASGSLDLDTYKEWAQRLGDIQRVADGSRDRYNEVNKTERGTKYKTYLKVIEAQLYKGESVLVFAEYLDTFAMLQSLLKEDLQVPIYTANSKETPEEYQKPCVMLLTASSAESLNLGFANHLMMYSIPFSVGRFIQIVGRITRMDSDYLDDMNVYLPTCDETIDKYKYKYMMTNVELINSVLGKEANLPTQELDETKKSMLQGLRKELVYRTKKKKL